MRIAIVLGSTRTGRKGEPVARWVVERAAQRTDATFELVDVAEHELGFVHEETIPGAAGGVYEDPRTTAWSEVVAQYDGFVFVTPEYNHSVPAALKNAFDVLYVEWVKKAIGFVGYGAAGGVRSVEHWRNIVANASMGVARGQVIVSTFVDFDGDDFTPTERLDKDLDALLTEVVALSEQYARARG